MFMRIANIDRYDLINNPMDKTASCTIWFAGCNFGCEDCQNPQLQSFDIGKIITAVDLGISVAEECKRLNIKSVVYLGGEPLQQNKHELLLLSKILTEYPNYKLKLWIYTGYDKEQVISDFNEILKYTHIIKCGRYIKDLHQDGFPASSNQKIYKVKAGDLLDITQTIRR